MTLMISLSGIRGIYDKDITETIAVKYTYAYYSYIRHKTKKNNPTLVIGRDTRSSGAKLSEAIIRILDCNFIDVGIAPTPAIEFAVRHFNADGGVIITASHNEPYWNGFKFLKGNGSILNEKEISTVANNFKTFKNFHKIQERKVLERNSETIQEYTNFILNIIGSENIERIKNSMQKIIIDPNGGTAVIAKKILEQIGINVTGVNLTYGEFNRIVEPNEDSLIYLKNIIEDNKADFAAGFDCDADRVEILLNSGRLLSGHYIFALVVHETLSSIKNPKQQIIVSNDATSNIVRHVADKFGAKVKEVEAGEINVVEQMQRSKAIVGGEGSNGGVIIPPSKCRDGILTMLKLLSIVAKNKKNLQAIVDDFPKYTTLKEKLVFNESKQIAIRKYLKGIYIKKGFEVREHGGLSGSLKVVTGKNSFVWFRASRTEANVFRIIADSDSKEEAEELMEEAISIFKKANE